MSAETITITREHYERLKNQRVAFFGANNGIWTDEELEMNAVSAAIEAAGQVIEEGKFTDRPLSALTHEQFSMLIQQACWKYLEVYLEYIPF